MANRIIMFILLSVSLFAQSSYKNITADEIKLNGKSIINYNNGLEGDNAKLFYYGGGVNIQFSLSPDGDVYVGDSLYVVNGIRSGLIKSTSTIDGLAYIVNGSVGINGQVLVSNGITGAVWGTAVTDTSVILTKSNTQVAYGEKYWMGAQHFAGDLLSTYIIRNPSSSLDLRAGNGTTGQDIVLGYGTGYGANVIFYNGSTTAKFVSYANGNAYIAGNMQVVGDVSADNITGDFIYLDTASVNKAVIGNLWISSSIKGTGGIDLRPASGNSVTFNYGNSGPGADVIFYDGTTAIGSVSEAGALYMASTGSFGGAVTIPADAYGSGWNGKQEAAPKDAVYDAIQGLSFTPTFSSLTGGTNTSAAMVVGTGASLSFTGTGSINASQYQGVTSVSGTEFGYLDGVTSAIQTQLNSKMGGTNPTASGILYFSGQAEIRAAAGQSVAFNYNQGADALYMYGGGTSVRFSVVNGVGYFADAAGTRANLGAAAASHTHAITEITNLRSELDAMWTEIHCLNTELGNPCE